MKFIGQYIQDFIARFRSDVYLEDISTGTIASGGNLGLDSNNKIVKADVPPDGDITSISISDGLTTSPMSSGDVTAQFLAGEGIDVAMNSLSATVKQITYSGEDASTSNKGVAKFNASYFDVSSGNVSLKDGAIDFTEDIITGTLPVGNGGTGATTLTSNSVLTGNGTSAVQAESELTYDSETLTIGADDNGIATIKRTRHSDEAGGDLYIRGGDATGTDKEGGVLRLYGGRGTSNAVGGAVTISTSNASGSSGTTLHTSQDIVATFKADKNVQLTGNLIFEGPTPDAHETTFSITDPTDDRTITVPDEDVDLAEVNHHYDYLHLNCQMTAASTNQYMGYGGHYNFNIGANLYSDGGSVNNKNTTKWSHYQAITAATIHTVMYNFTTTGGSGNDFVFELWEIVPGSGSSNNTTNLIKQYTISGNSSNDFIITATDTTGYSLAAGAGLLPVIRKTTSAWSGNIFGEMTIKFKY